MHDLVLGDAVAHFGVETARRADACYDGVGVEAVEDATGSYLVFGRGLVSYLNFASAS